MIPECSRCGFQNCVNSDPLLMLPPITLFWKNYRVARSLEYEHRQSIDPCACHRDRGSADTFHRHSKSRHRSLLCAEDCRVSVGFARSAQRFRNASSPRTGVPHISPAFGEMWELTIISLALSGVSGQSTRGKRKPPPDLRMKNSWPDGNDPIGLQDERNP
jgi:hypothetical protein